VRDEEGDSARLVVLVAEEDDGMVLDDTGQALEAGRGQHVQGNHGDSTPPEITEKVVERHRPIRGCKLSPPRTTISGESRMGLLTVSEISNDGASDLERGVNRRSEPIPIHAPNPSQPGSSHHGRCKSAPGIPHCRERIPQEPRDPKLDFGQELGVVRALFVPPIRQDCRAHEGCIEPGLRQAAHEALGGGLGQWRPPGCERFSVWVVRPDDTSLRFSR